MYAGVYGNEVLLAFPVLLWWSARKHPLQRVVDVLRVVGLWYLIISVSLPPPHRPSPALAVAAAAWTVVANIAQARVDRAHPPQHWSPVVHGLSYLGAYHWLSSSLAPPRLRLLAVGVNLVAVGVLATEVLFFAPLSSAWLCYGSGDPADFTRGYCPQYTGAYHGNAACSFTADHFLETEANPRCSPKEWGEYADVVGSLGGEAVAAVIALAATLALHLRLIQTSLRKERLRACIALAHATDRDFAQPTVVESAKLL